eukprot:GHVT01086796.1.p1 GENE.GHVT01086796.1~~GHVT01086796.1.p1  ORF type:complete len:456 (+),score=62.68 GHVT01086796.1:142-1509(+)
MRELLREAHDKVADCCSYGGTGGISDSEVFCPCKNCAEVYALRFTKRGHTPKRLVDRSFRQPAGKRRRRPAARRPSAPAYPKRSSTKPRETDTNAPSSAATANAKSPFETRRATLPEPMTAVAAESPNAAATVRSPHGSKTTSRTISGSNKMVKTENTLPPKRIQPQAGKCSLDATLTLNLFPGQSAGRGGPPPLSPSDCTSDPPEGGGNRPVRPRQGPFSKGRRSSLQTLGAAGPKKESRSTACVGKPNLVKPQPRPMIPPFAALTAQEPVDAAEVTGEAGCGLEATLTGINSLLCGSGASAVAPPSRAAVIAALRGAAEITQPLRRGRPPRSQQSQSKPAEVKREKNDRQRREESDDEDDYFNDAFDGSKRNADRCHREGGRRACRRPMGVRQTEQIEFFDSEIGQVFRFRGRRGVYYDRNRRIWRANWKDNDRIYTKSFSVKGRISPMLTVA